MLNDNKVWHVAYHCKYDKIIQTVLELYTFSYLYWFQMKMDENNLTYLPEANVYSNRKEIYVEIFTGNIGFKDP